MSFFKEKGKAPAQPEDKDYSIQVELTDDQEQIHFFRNRKKDDLPEHLKGSARWKEHHPSRRNTYEVQVNDQGFSVKYINNEWYYTTWDSLREAYAVVGEDRISRPYELGLGMRALPYETREQPQIESEQEGSPKETTDEQEQSASDQDTPIITRHQTEVLDKLAEKLGDETGIGYPHTLQYTINPIFKRDESEVENYQALAQGILQQMTTTIANTAVAIPM